MTNEATLVGEAPFPRLVVRVHGRVIQEITVRTEVTVGRAEDNDLTLTDPKVSRHHARVRREGSAFVVTDLDSANGTLVNDVRLTEPHTLQHGERIVVGDTELLYLEPGPLAEDTLVAPVAIPATSDALPGRVVPPPPSRAPSRDRGFTIGLVAGAIVLFLALAALTVYLLAFDGLEQLGLVGQATATAPVVAETATPTPPPATVGSAVTPVGSPPPTAALPATTATSGVTDEFDDLLTQAAALTRRSKFEEAMVVYDDLAQRAPEDARPEIGRAWVLILDDQAAQALDHAQRAVELDPTSSLAATVLARAYIETGDEARALDVAQDAVQLDAGSAQAHAVLAEAYMVNGQLQEAVDEADLALVQDINNADAHRIRGWLYQVADNDMGRAAGELQSAAGLEPELWIRRHELGVLLLEVEDYTTALMAFQDALGIRPKAVTYTAIGQAYYELGQYDQARASLQQALSVGAEDAHTHALLAATYANLGRCDDAETHYEQALDMDPADPVALEAQGICQGTRPSPTPSATTVAASTPAPAPTTATTPVPVRASPRPAALSGRIAFPVWSAETRQYDVYVAQAADGSGRTLVIEDMHQPAFSPDGNWLAVNGERPEHMNLFIVRPDGSGLHEITEHIEDGLPCWSPDGRGLVFSSTRHGDKQSRVYVIDEVPFAGGRAQGRPLNFGPDDVRGEFPAWTSDDRIVYKGCDLTVEPARCGLYIMTAAAGAHPTRQLTEIADDTAPAAYGSRIAFMSNREGNWELYIMNDDGSGVRRLTNNAANDGLPTWSPDGRTLAFVSDQGGPWAVWAISPDGSNRRKLFDVGGRGLASDWQHERISWGP
jgi:tetratricopeptide (TPR) repeat protein/pSer/pThr/pTyr-binding forkhead associated (FHA) protein